MNGGCRGKTLRTTIPAKDSRRPDDLLDRDFTAPAPNTCWVADFTYCRTWAGFVYVALIVDVFAQRIVGWHAATDRRAELVLTPLRIALWDRDRQGAPIQSGQLLHHYDAGSQYTIRFTERLGHHRLPRRPPQGPRRHRVRHRRLGRLAQPPTPARHPPHTHSDRVRTRLLRGPQHRRTTRITAAQNP